MNVQILTEMVSRLETLAFSMPAPNTYTPTFVGICIEMRVALFDAKAGLTPRAKRMPDTHAEFDYMVTLLEKGLLEEQAANAKLRHKINDQVQSLAKQRRTIKNLGEAMEHMK